MSGVFSMVSHWMLQYFPAIAVHEQFGWAHFFGLSVAIHSSAVKFVPEFSGDHYLLRTGATPNPERT
jgi:hypothetical protein